MFLIWLDLLPQMQAFEHRLPVDTEQQKKGIGLIPLAALVIGSAIGLDFYRGTRY